MATQFTKLVTLFMPKRNWFQFRLRTLFAVVTASALLFWAHWIAWPSWSEYRLAQSLREKVLQAQTSREKGKAYKQLVEQVQPQTLKRLQRDREPNIALKAAYAYNHRGTSVFAPMAPDRAKVFLEFLTDRISLEPPPWWAPHFGKRDPWNFNSNLDAVSCEANGRELHVRQGDRSVRLTYPRPRLPDYDACLAVFASHHAYVALPPIEGSAFPLVCVELKSGQVCWEVDVWALGFDNVGDYAGAVYHVAELTLQGDSVVVWGDGVGGSYVESFDAGTGVNRFRFCTEYWFFDH